MKKTILSAAITGLMAISGSAAAVPLTFTFDPTGGGGGMAGNATLDWAPGNTLAVGSGGLPPQQGMSLTDYFQANLGVVKDGGGSVTFANGTGGSYFTLVAGFGETVTGGGLIGGNWTNSMVLDPSNPVNYFKMYATGAVGNDLTGAGFTSPKVILSGTITGVNANVMATGNPGGVAPVGLLDQFQANDWGNTQSIFTIGAASLVAKITGADAGYFPSLVPGGSFVIALSNTSLITPFNQVNPSQCLSDGVADCVIASNIGPINGISGPDFLFQSDANSSFVPEPGSVALFGAALLGFALSRKRKF